jgi:predicted nucleic acid-binding protein
VRWLVDTCVLSELTKKSPAALVVGWLQLNVNETAMSMVSLGEIQHGIERMPPSRNRNALQQWFDRLCVQYGQRTIPVDEPVWRAYAKLRASVEAMGRPQADVDLLIAATASVHHLTLVTRNTRHFQDTGVALYDPWAHA